MSDDARRPFAVNWSQCHERHTAALTLWVRFQLGLTFPQIGARLNRSTDAVTKTWQRSLPLLRDLLGKLL